MKLYEILPGQLYTRGRFDKWPRERKLRELRDAGIDVVVSLTPRVDLDLTDTQELEYIHRPMVDNRLVDIGTLWSTVSLVVRRLQLGQRVLVHCHAGKNRTGLVATWVVSELLGIGGAKALGLVRENLPHAVHNSHFATFLEMLAAPNDYVPVDNDYWVRTGAVGQSDRLILQKRDWRRLPVQSDDVVLDVGAYIGSFTRWAAKQAHHVIAVEPEPRNFQVLMRNVRGLTNVDLMHAAVVDQPARSATLLLGVAPYGHSLVCGGKEGSVEVSAITLTELFETYQPTVLKVDIEGGEFDLRELKRLPACVRLIGFELHLTRKVWCELADQLTTSLREQGFELYREYLTGKWRQNKIVMGVRPCL